MGTLTIYGASDDLIEIEGDFEDEIGANDDNKNFVHLDDGTVIHAVYDNDGIWRMKVVTLGDGTAVKSHKVGDVEADTMDRLVLTRKGKFKSFRFWHSAGEPTAKELFDYVDRWLDQEGIEDLSPAKIKAIYEVISGE